MSIRRVSLICLSFIYFEFPVSGAHPTVPSTPGRVLSLNGTWRFRTDPGAKLSQRRATAKQGSRPIRVPSPWEACYPSLVSYDGVAWYWRRFRVPADWKGMRIWIQFDAVDYSAEVWVNDVLLGNHEGGYTPFEFEISGALRWNESNTVVVRVIDPGREPAGAHGLTVAEVPAGKQGHYCNIGGLWQAVRLVARPPSFVSDLTVFPDAKTGLVRASIAINRASPEPGRLSIEIRGESGKAAGGGPWSTETKVASGAEKAGATLRLTQPALWSPVSPNLYRLRATLRFSTMQETVETTFGFRSIELLNGKILLNGQPIIFRAALDQDFYPDDIYVPRDPGFFERQFRLAKQLGLNGMRTHIKIPAPGYIDAADRAGILLWIDFPSWFRFTTETDRRARTQIREWIARDRNHPSIFAWCLINEEWGLNMRDPQKRAWLASWWREVKALDPTRAVVDNSPAGGGHVISDIADQHAYFAIPDQLQRACSWIDRFADSRRERFPHPESRMRGFEPLLWSEFGDWGLPNVENLLAYYGGRDPYWFNQSNYGGPIRPGIEAFKKWGIADIYGGFPALARATQLHEGEALKLQIERLRRYSTIAGYVITQWSDLNSESNGLVDMCRNPKAFHRMLRYSQADLMVFADAPKRNLWPGDETLLRLFVSNFGPKPVIGAEVTVSYKTAEGQKQIALFPCKRIGCGEAFEVGLTPVVFSEDILKQQGKSPAERGPVPARKIRIQLILKAGGKELARNFFDLWVFRRPEAEEAGGKTGAKIVVADSIVPSLRKKLAARYSVSAGSYPQGAVLVAADVTPETCAFAKQGGYVLLLTDRGLRAQGRELGRPSISTNRRGLGHGWIQPHWFMRCDDTPLGRLFRGIPYEGHFGMAFAHSLPRGFVRQVAPEDFKRAVVVGGFAAWCHDVAAVCAGFRVGRGTVLFYGIDTKAYGEDPMATAMLDRAIERISLLKAEDLPPLELIFVRPISPTGENGPVLWKYTTRAPSRTWREPGFDDSRWQRGKAPFGRPGTPGIRPQTAWTTRDIWLRRTFIWDGESRGVFLRLYHDEDCEVYLNGVLIAREKGYVTSYKEIGLTKKAFQALRKGKNVLAVHCIQTTGGQGIDVGIIARMPGK